MTVEIPPKHEQFVKAAIARGRFTSEADLVSEAIRLLEERDRQADFLRREMLVGLEELDRGEYVEYDDASLKEFLEQVKAEGRQALEGGLRG
ncbi:MAG: type II toxin-antitoxin system ParD family antitoxin [Thermoguttaceae bacterium]